VRCLLIEPFPESALNEQAGKLLLENYEDFARHARLYTSIHALRPKNKSKTGAISESATALNKDQAHAILAPISTSTAPKAFGPNSQDQNAVPSALLGGASAAHKKDGPLSVKVPIDKKKMDARKKSLKRL
jgi:ubiquitin-conjugating enzyme E2 S